MNFDGQKVLDKIKSDDLREDALHSAPSSHTVLVEVGLPLPTIERSSREAVTFGRSGLRVGGGAPSSESVDQARHELEQALGHQTQRYLPSSRSFVVEATGRELRRIAEVPAVVAIWPNTNRGYRAY
ncbi:MAG: hypothetical protein K2Z25_10100 [Beijerinckiaceae bacterium]|nr:hypothetical protein [Beijerinckiaceae bacterium]